MSDRGMMKWAPYKSLVEQADALEETSSKSLKKEKPILEEDLINQINFILSTYHNQEVTLTYWENGFIYKENGTISKIDTVSKFVRINRKCIYLDSIVNLEEN